MLDSNLDLAATLESPETLKVIVSKDKASNSYTVSEKQLTEVSRFCLAASQRKREQGRKNEITLPIHDVEDFEVYLHLLNTGSVVTANQELHIGTSKPVNLSHNRLHEALVKLCLLAKYIDDMKGEKAFIDALIKKIVAGDN